MKLKEKETVHISWINEMSDHQRSLLELKETQHQLTTALYPGRDKGMIFKISLPTGKLSKVCKFRTHLKISLTLRVTSLKISWPTAKLSESYKFGSHLKISKKICIIHILILPSR